MRAQKRAERTEQDLPFCHNEPLNNEVLGETNDIKRSSNAKNCGKEPQYNETSLLRTYSASPTALPFVISTFHCILFLDPRSLQRVTSVSARVRRESWEARKKFCSR